MTPMPPEKTSPVMWKGELWYATTATTDGQVSYIKPEDVLHIMGLTTDGYVGLSPIQTCKNAFGLALGAEKFGAQFFGNGAKATGVLSHPGQLDTEAYENLKKSLREMMTGENALRPLLLEEGMKWEQTSTNPNDAQFLETRQFQRSEIAALYRVAMHLLQDLQRATNNNIEHQSLDHLRYCLRPWAIRLEQEFNRKILEVDSGFFCEHDMNAFQRGDFASQTTGLATLRAAGFFSVNDGLRVMRMNTISAEDGGDLRLAPINMVPLEQMLDGPQLDDDDGDGSATDPETPIEPITDLRRERIVNAYRRLFRDAVGRTVKRSKPEARWVAKAFEPILTTMGETLLTMFVGGAITLTDEDEAKIRAHAAKIAAESPNWTAENASTTATSLTNQAYTALAEALTGR
jgi:HK97 family phage portal protein